MKKIDTVILGGGPAGYHAALLLKKNGVDVAVIEKKYIGGTCLHEGCIPTKSLLNSAKHINGQPDVIAIMQKKHCDVNKLFKGLKYQFQKNNIPIINGLGKIIDKEGRLLLSVDNEDIYFKHLILATGSHNIEVNIPGLFESLSSGKAVYSDGFLDLDIIPDNIAIIGGGVIGLEFASFLCMINRKVTVIEGKNEILNNMLDSDCCTLYREALEKSGVNVVTGAIIEEIDGGDITYKLKDDYIEANFDLVLIACGRKANTEQIGLEVAGIKLKNGFVSVNSNCQTNIPNVYACGDIIGKSMLAHSAYLEAEVIVADILGQQKVLLYDAVPNVIYSNPEVAYVGISEEYCKSNNIPYYVKKESMLFSGRYLVEHGSFPGICKMIFSEDGILIGAQMVGNSSSETIFTLSDMIANKTTNEEIVNKCYPHPSFVEIIKEVASL